MNWVTLRKWRGPSPCGHISTLRRQHHVHRAGFGRDSLGTPLAKPYILHAHGPRPLLSGRKHGGAEINCQHVPVRGDSDPISRAATLFLHDRDRRWWAHATSPCYLRTPIRSVPVPCAHREVGCPSSWASP